MSRHARLFLLVLALMARLAIPAGFMLAPAGVAALVACPAVAPVPSVMAHHHGHHDPAAHAQHLCPYAAMAAQALPPAPAVFVVDRPAPTPLAPAPLLRAAAAPPLAAPPPPSRGPPLLS